MGAKIWLNGTSKIEHTHGQTHKHTHGHLDFYEALKIKLSSVIVNFSNKIRVLYLSENTVMYSKRLVLANLVVLWG